MADAERRIAITMDLVPGKGNVQVAKTLAAQILAVQKTSANGRAKVVAAGLKKQERDEKTAAKANTARQKQAERETKKTEREKQQAAKATARVQTQLAKERSREIEANLSKSAKAVANEKRTVLKAEREKTAAVKATEMARKRAAATHERLTQRGIEINDRMGETFAGLLGDTMKFGRGFAMLGLVGEENLEKLLRNLIKVQAAFDIIGGAMQAWVKYGKIMRDVATATQTAAAAHTALAAAQVTAGVAMGAGGVATGVAVGEGLGDVGETLLGGGASGVAAGATGRVAVRGGISGIIGALKGGLAVAGAKLLAFAALVASAGFAVKSLKEAAEGQTGAPGTISGQLGTKLFGGLAGRIQKMTPAERQAELKRRRAAVGRGGADTGLFEASLAQVESAEKVARLTEKRKADLAEQKQQRAIARQAQAFRDVGMGPRERLGRARQDVEAGVEGADQAHITALQAFKDLRKQEQAIVIATNRAAIEGLRQQAKQYLALADQIKQSRLTAEQRFGAADVGTQQALVRLSEKARSGAQLTREEAAKLQQFAPAGSDIAGTARGTFTRFAQEGGRFGQFVGKEQRKQEAEQRRQASGEFARADVVERRLEVMIKDDRNLIVKIERDDEGLIRDLLPRVQTALDDRDEALRDEIERAIQDFETNERSRQGVQGATVGVT